jgi:hypothetical protein
MSWGFRFSGRAPSQAAYRTSDQRVTHQRLVLNPGGTENHHDTVYQHGNMVLR